MTVYVELDAVRRPPSPAMSTPVTQRPQAVWRICPETNRPVMVWTLPDPPRHVIAAAA